MLLCGTVLGGFVFRLQRSWFTWRVRGYGLSAEYLLIFYILYLQSKSHKDCTIFKEDHKNMTKSPSWFEVNQVGDFDKFLRPSKNVFELS